MEVGVRIMGAQRAARLWRGLTSPSCLGPGQELRLPPLCALRAPGLPSGVCGAADSAWPHLSRLSTPRGPVTYSGGRFPLAIQTQPLGEDLSYWVTPKG